MSASKTRQQGFSLIEVLIAIAIFASLSLGAYQVVNQVQRSNELSADRSERIKGLQRAFVYLDNDFRQMAVRQYRTNGEEPTKQLVQWKENLLDSDSYGLMFVRTGWQNPAQQFPRGEVTKVGYRMRDNVLERVWWRYPDTTVAQEPIVFPLVDKVTDFSMRFNDGNQWTEKWGEDNPEHENRLPKAVELRLELEDYGVIERVYLVPAGQIQQDQGDSDGS
ncbi:type II secretion system minor pseudopilin GspJ [Vibrio sonorensis]|uniref:type II secretion system minor pseudopilin GspJ n=1 Tax=Vibrio sonorensis TaxID=1004316 RepID=UPI0008D946AD|nr:type II secretion system minor pseudopilin GspJ [Vibrio sonorensis]